MWCGVVWCGVVLAGREIDDFGANIGGAGFGFSVFTMFIMVYDI